MLRRILFGTFAALAFASPAFAVTCNPSSGFVKSVGQYDIGDAVIFGPDCEQVQSFGPGFAGFANPTAQIGLTVVNGVAATAMRSDAAPPLNQGIGPTWTGRHAWSVSPTYDLAAGVLGVATLFNSGNQSIPANKQWNFIGIRDTAGADPTWTLGAAALLQGIYFQPNIDAGSDATSNAYAATLGVTNAGPGIAKALHIVAAGSGTSAGQIIGVNGQVQPVSTNSYASSFFSSLTSTGVDGKAIGYGIETLGDTFQIGFGSAVAPVGYQNAAYRAWMGTRSDVNARAFQLLNNAGTEIAYWHKDGTIQSGLAGTQTGKVTFGGATSGNAVVTAQATAGTPTLSLPISTGTLVSTASAPLAINATTGQISCPTCGVGSVTSVSWTGGIVSVANPTSTPAFTIAGTSGGVPYFSGATTWASSAALAANALVIGGGAGAAPATTTTGSGILTFLGTPSSANLATAVTDETGSGALVFANTPTFAAKTIHPAGLAATPSIVVSGGADTGIYWPAVNVLAASTAGVERWRVGATGVFNVGTVSGGGLGEIAAFQGFILVGDPTGAYANPTFLLGNTGSGTAIVGGLSNHDVEMRANNIEVIRLKAATAGNGNVQFTNAGNWSANGAVATALTAVGPTGAHTTVQEWLNVKNSAGTTRWVPAF